MKHKHCCKPKVKPVSYNEYFNVGNRVLVEVKCDNSHHNHQPICVIKPEYPVKPPVKPDKPDHDHDCFEPFPPCKPSDNIWTDSPDDCIHDWDFCNKPHPVPPIPKPPHHHELEDRDDDGFFEGTFIHKH